MYRRLRGKLHFLVPTLRSIFCDTDFVHYMTCKLKRFVTLFWYAVGTNLPFSFGPHRLRPPGCCCSGFRLPRLHVRVHVDLLVAGAWQHTAVRVVCEVHRVPCVRSYPSCTIRPHATTHTHALPSLGGFRHHHHFPTIRLSVCVPWRLPSSLRAFVAALSPGQRPFRRQESHCCHSYYYKHEYSAQDDGRRSSANHPKRGRRGVHDGASSAVGRVDPR